MADLYDTPKAERTREAVEAHYRERFPILAAYLDIVAERNHNDARGINELFNNPTAVDTVTGAALALERIGRPARDRQDALHAERYIRALQDEMASEFPPVELTIVEAVIDALYGFAGCMPTDSDWADFDTQDSDFYLDEVVAGLPDHTDELKRLLGETLKHAMPSILREITARYGTNRHLSAVKDRGTQIVSTPGGERHYTLAEAADLLRAAAEGGDAP